MSNYAHDGHSQSAERLASRGGFSYSELVVYYLKHEPTTWRPAGRGDLWNKAEDAKVEE